MRDNSVLRIAALLTGLHSCKDHMTLQGFLSSTTMRLLEPHKRVRTAFVCPIKPADSDWEEPQQMFEQAICKNRGQTLELN